MTSVPLKKSSTRRVLTDALAQKIAEVKEPATVTDGAQELPGVRNHTHAMLMNLSSDGDSAARIKTATVPELANIENALA